MDDKNWKFKIENLECELKVSNIRIKQLKAKETVRTLGVHVCPQLQWNEQFKVIKEKMIKFVAKLNNTDFKPHLMCLYFKACLLKKVFWMWSNKV